MTEPLTGCQHLFQGAECLYCEISPGDLIIDLRAENERLRAVVTAAQDILIGRSDCILRFWAAVDEALGGDA
jgi:hypothetical protein